MAELRQNTWSLDEWYDQNVAGTTGGYQWGGTLWAQGANWNGALINNLPPATKVSSPTQVPGTDWQKIAYGPFAIKKDSSLWTWGSVQQGRQGQNQAPNPSTLVSSPIQVGSGTDWSFISGSASNCIAIKTDGTAWVWGENNYGQLGQNSVVDQSSPTQFGTATNWATGVAGGSNYNISAINTDGELWSCGYNNGILGQNNTVKYSSPVQVPGTWATSDGSVSHNTSTTGAIKSDGTAWVWGGNASGNLGLNQPPAGGMTSYSSPMQIGTDTNWKKLVFQSLGPGIRMSLAFKTDGTIWSWGSNTYGGLGLNQAGNPIQISSPTQIGTGTDWTSRTYGIGEKGNIAAIKTDGTYWTWGQNYYGGLGLNESGYPPMEAKSSPTQVGSGTNWYSAFQQSDTQGFAIKQ